MQSAQITRLFLLLSVAVNLVLASYIGGVLVKESTPSFAEPPIQLYQLAEHLSPAGKAIMQSEIRKGMLAAMPLMLEHQNVRSGMIDILEQPEINQAELDVQLTKMQALIVGTINHMHPYMANVMRTLPHEDRLKLRTFLRESDSTRAEMLKFRQLKP